MDFCVTSDKLVELGAKKVLLAGSGSCLLAFVEDEADARRLEQKVRRAFSPDYWTASASFSLAS